MAEDSAKPLVYITGSGGKDAGGSAHVAQESADSLRSMATARIMDLVCEGEVEGLVDGLKSVYLDETPLENQDGSFNFKNVTVQLNTGTQHQMYIPGFAESEAETAVGAEVKFAVPLTRQITDENITAVRITIGIPQLYSQDKTNGDMNGTSVGIAIDVQPFGGAWQEVKSDTITGKTMSRYQRAYRIPLTGSAPWQLRVRRITEDSTSAALLNKTTWDSYTEIIEAKLRYPNSAIVAVTADSSQFSAVPKRAYDMMLQRLRVPANYDPATRTYNGMWDGSFKTAWTDNPAWGFYAVATNERYGLGRFIPEALMDKWTLYTIGQYCDGLVPDGFGGMEPRFTLNVYISTRVQAFKLLNDLASVFRGMAYYAGGVITAAQDSPSDPVQPFNNANVVGGRFVYSGTAKRARHTVALVAYNDPADFYRQKVEYVEDTDGIRRYGLNPTEITAIGCTSRAQARRAGKWLLYTEQEETETVAFRTGLEGVYLRPGNVIPIYDRHRAGRRMSGRISSVAGTTVNLDAPFEIEAGKSYTISCILPDGTTEERSVTNDPGTTAAITFAVPFSTPPQTEAIWAITASDLAPTLWRVLAVTEPEKHQVEITALEHNPGKYALIEEGIQLDAPPTSGLPSAGLVEPPASVTVTEEIYPAALGTAGVRLIITWEGSPNRFVTRYTCRLRRENGNWIDLPVDGCVAQYDGATQGIYQVQVTAWNLLGIGSVPAGPELDQTYEVIAMTAPPADVTGLQIYGRGNTTDYEGRECRLSWNRVSTIDAEGPADGAAGAQPHTGWLRDYVVTLYNLDGSQRRMEFPTIETYNYGYERNFADGDSNAARSFTVGVYARDRWMRTSVNEARITVNNPQARQLLPGEITTHAFARAFTVDLTPIAIPDIAGYEIHASQQAGFVPTADTRLSDGSTHAYKPAQPGTWYIRAGAYDSFGKDGINWSEQISVQVIEALVLPDQLYTSLRTDFWIRDSIFFFNSATLEWTVGSIIRGVDSFSLAGGNLALASEKYIIAALAGGTATLRMTSFAAGIPALAGNEIIIAVTSGQPNTAGNYICYVRQANSMQLEGAIIRDATLTDAKLTGTLSANRIVTLNGSVEISGTGITLTSINQTANIGVTNASTALTAANDAQVSAAAAFYLLQDIASDSKFTPGEKSAVLKEWNAIVAEKAGIDTQADTYTLSRTSYDNYYAALNTYITPLLADPAATSDIVGTTFRAKFNDYYLSRTTLLNLIATTARQLAVAAAATSTWAGTTGIPLRFADTAPAGGGLSITPGYMGYYASGAWKSYIKNDGSFYFGGKDANSFIRWDGGTADLLIRGKLTADDITAGGTIRGARFETVTPGGGKSFVADAANNECYCYGLDASMVVRMGQNIGSDTFGAGSYSLLALGNSGYTNHGMTIEMSGGANSMVMMAYDYGSGGGFDYINIAGTGRAGFKADMHYYGNAIVGIAAYGVGGNFTSAYNHGVCAASNGSGKYAFYARTGFTGSASLGSGSYAPFTGCHDALILKADGSDAGDIVVDQEILFRHGWSDTISRVNTSTTAMQPNCIGVVVGRSTLKTDEMLDVSSMIDASFVEWADAVARYDILSVNALGEGQMNVCREGGNIAAGDLICSSSTPGKGMRQPDDLMHGYTVAKARESVAWDNGDNSIRQIACTYHCG